MNKAEFISYIAEEYGCFPDHPFEGDTETSVFRHDTNRKWFALVMTVDRSKFTPESGRCDVVNLKCDPSLAHSFYKEKGIYPAYHMNKTHWISVLLDGSASDDNIRFLLHCSYTLTAPKMKKRKA